ncbi:MAG TPA: zf-HC2 domain-containing protein, partial [Pyrinomonadaceae bacterium]
MTENRNAADFAGAAPRGCERADEFVTYLYGEATPEEAKAFRPHLEACAVCRDELAALGGVRLE